jgi:uncharacterized membrane protein YjfL (UPF0719 family)
MPHNQAIKHHTLMWGIVGNTVQLTAFGALRLSLKKLKPKAAQKG